MSRTDCVTNKNYLYPESYVGVREFCAIDPKERESSTCQGDSGGPLIETKMFGFGKSKSNMVLGIVNKAIYCGLKNAPTVYARVKEFHDAIWATQNWLKEHYVNGQPTLQDPNTQPFYPA